MNSEQNKERLRDFVEAIWNQGRFDEIHHYVAADFVLQHAAMPVRGPAALVDLIDIYRNAFPDLRLTIEDLVAEGDRVVARYLLTGTQYGPLFGFEASGQRVSIPGLSLVLMNQGLQQVEWSHWDSMSAMQQIGAFTGPPEE